jgi:hypothetical protein
MYPPGPRRAVVVPQRSGRILAGNISSPESEQEGVDGRNQGQDASISTRVAGEADAGTEEVQSGRDAEGEKDPEYVRPENGLRLGVPIADEASTTMFVSIGE